MHALHEALPSLNSCVCFHSAHSAHWTQPLHGLQVCLMSRLRFRTVDFEKNPSGQLWLQFVHVSRSPGILAALATASANIVLDILFPESCLAANAFSLHPRQRAQSPWQRINGRISSGAQTPNAVAFFMKSNSPWRKHCAHLCMLCKGSGGLALDLRSPVSASSQRSCAASAERRPQSLSSRMLGPSGGPRSKSCFPKGCMIQTFSSHRARENMV